MAAFCFGLIGLGAAVVLCGLWFGAALLFGFGAPSSDQFSGLLLLFGCGGVALGAVLTAVFS